MLDQSFDDALKETNTTRTELGIISKIEYTMVFSTVTVHYNVFLN